MELRIHERVLRRMHDEPRRYSVETGGLVVGPDESTITELLASGDQAQRSAVSYTLDVQHLQPLLDRAMDRGLRLLGVWHVHPAGVPQLSETDRRTAWRMLHERDYGLSRVLLPLTVRTNAGFETRFFCAQGRRPTITLIPKVTVCAGNSPTGNTGQSTARAGERDLSSHRAETIEAARAELDAAGWHTSLREFGNGGALCAERAQVTLWAVLPQEFPLGPPDLYVEDPGTSEGLAPVPHTELPETHYWSSERSLAEVFAQADRAIRAEREAFALFKRRGLRKLFGIPHPILRRSP